jgi:hypothetical protein
VTGANYLAPDGYRYGVQWRDGSVANRWNGRTQADRARQYLADVIAQQLADVGRHDVLVLVRRRSDADPWEPVA